MDTPFNMTVETVNIVSETGQRLRINKSDYLAMEPENRPALWGADKEGSEIDPNNPPVNPTVAQPGPIGGGFVDKKDLRVIKEKTRWYVVDLDGSKVAGFDKENGYKTDVEAWAAIWPQTENTPPVNSPNG